MRYLDSFIACLVSGVCFLACTSPADVASRADAETGGQNNGAGAPSVGGGFAAGATAGGALGQGGTTNATGGTSNGVAGSGDQEEIRTPLPPITNPDIADAEYAAFIGDSNAFGLELQQRLVTNLSLTDKNSVFSPVSAQLALAMTYGAAVGNTADEMKTVLHDNLGGTKYHAACNRLLRDLASRNYSRTDHEGNNLRIQLSPANSLWTDRSVAIKSSFLDLLGQQYDSGMRRVNFAGQPESARLAINAWVEDMTHDRIKDLLREGDINDMTRFVLVNALYFYGNWEASFQKSFTKQGAFHTLAGSDATVDMMNQRGDKQYKVAGNVEVLRLPYLTGNLWMTLVLPAAGQFEATRAAVSGAWLSETTAGLTSTYVELTLPKFKIETPQLSLVNSLKAMGMQNAFMQTADLTGMTDLRPLYVAQVVQKAFIGIDEYGTEAAAATAVMGETVSIPPPPTPVVVDRPFLFFIQDKTGLVLFSGQVVDPTQ